MLNRKSCTQTTTTTTIAAYTSSRAQRSIRNPILFAMLSSLLRSSCSWTAAGRRPSFWTMSVATAFVPSNSIRFLGTKTSWKAQVLRDNSPKQAIQEVKKKTGPRLVKRGKHLTSHKKRRDDTELFRADRVLANRTGQSRKECFALLQQRRVYQVLGRDTTKFESSLILQVVPGPKSKIPKHAALRIDRKHDVPMPPPLLVVYHKPKVGSFAFTCCVFRWIYASWGLQVLTFSFLV